jgi:hypothetical protein
MFSVRLAGTNVGIGSGLEYPGGMPGDIGFILSWK